MKGLDTNVLVRYLVSDDVAQMKRAISIVKDAVRNDEKLYLNLVVICETVWVLETAYGIAKPEIVGALRKVFSTKQFSFQEKEILWKALDEYTNHAVDFADSVIGFVNIKNDCSTTHTFDRSLRKLKSFSVLM